MQSKPLIGLNADFRSVQRDSPAFSYVCAGYYDCITAVGGIPIILPPLEADADRVSATSIAARTGGRSR